MCKRSCHVYLPTVVLDSLADLMAFEIALTLAMATALKTSTPPASTTLPLTAWTTKPAASNVTRTKRLYTRAQVDGSGSEDPDRLRRNDDDGWAVVGSLACFWALMWHHSL